ncbi:MAG: YgjV family protein [Oscillospiraceae bacterium]|nr:YgjV family protein [Oscillospiraceae bacterium]
MERIIIEAVGYIGTALVIISMLMTSVVKLRVINTVGSIFSFVYAMIWHTYPVAIMNICLIIINVYNLIKLFKPSKHFDMIVVNPGDSVLQYFLKRWSDDLKLYFPEFDRKAPAADRAYFVFCNGNPAGVLMAKETETGILDIALDYTTPAYRDCSVAKYLHSKLPDKGVHTLQYTQNLTKEHTKYLQNMAYTEQNGIFVKKLS